MKLRPKSPNFTKELFPWSCASEACLAIFRRKTSPAFGLNKDFPTLSLYNNNNNKPFISLSGEKHLLTVNNKTLNLLVQLVAPGSIIHRSDAI